MIKEIVDRIVVVLIIVFVLICAVINHIYKPSTSEFIIIMILVLILVPSIFIGADIIVGYSMQDKIKNENTF